VSDKDLCGLYRKVIEDLRRISQTPGYIDKRGGLTSEGRAYIAIIARYMARNRLGCLEILWELRDRLDKIESLYQCIQNHIERCEEEV
jgi:hypothetical protein